MYLTNDLMNWADWLNYICILRVMDIHWSYQNLLFWIIGSQPTRLSDVLNFKNFKTIRGIKLISCFHWSYKKYHTILGYTGKHSWPISLQEFLLLTCLTCLTLFYRGFIATLLFFNTFLIELNNINININIRVKEH